LAWVVGIICVVLIVVFWRIFLPLALVAAVALVLLFGYVQSENDKSERKRKATEQTVRQKIDNAKAIASTTARSWEVSSEADPASGAKIPRNAGVRSDDNLCWLQVEERLNGAKLTGIYCQGLKVSSWKDIEVKFDNRPTSDTMRLERFTDGDAVYIPSYQYTYSRQLSYDEFLRRMTGANKMAILLTFEEAGQHWVTFSLEGSNAALAKIGALTSRSGK
jgi:hypothetical protein